MADFNLIETLRWEPAAGFTRGDRHIARLAASAGEFGFAFDASSARAALDAAVSGAGPLRVRVELSPDGAVAVTTAPFVSIAPGNVWRLRIAAIRLVSSDRLLRHKTTRRNAYDIARSEFPASAVDEVLLLNERGEVCEGTITSVFMRREAGAPLVTPPLSCGLLAGVLRAELLEYGDAVEDTLDPSDLADAAELLVGNSLRGLIPARVE
jgi:4-amino-4-deoxychorismate lyase